uniref:Photosystem I reaction center subunit Nic-like isoform X1 n=1 Tax=Rhizophora mucronata TaxID=61149 RepID=A0A2P2KSD7_RHIMU
MFFGNGENSKSMPFKYPFSCMYVMLHGCNFASIRYLKTSLCYSLPPCSRSLLKFKTAAAPKIT